MGHPPSPIPPLEAKRRLPALREGLVPRARLMQPLLGSADLPLALVVAPAGYGKTTLLTQWSVQDRRSFAWLTLDERDNDLRELLASIAAVLDSLEPIDDELCAELAAPRSRTAGLLAALLRTVESRSRSFVLVLDDLHVLEAEKSIGALSAIVDHLQRGSQLAVASRDEPRMAVGRLRANRSVLELRFADLVMTPSEGAALLTSAGLELRREELEGIVRRTEGWAAGLYLAALSLRGSVNPATAALSFGGDDRLVADYLRDEILSGLSPGHVGFLTMASVLETLSAPLCDAVLERSDSGRVLGLLERSNVMVFRTEDGYYRYHGLLRQMLEAELSRSDPELAGILHQRAADWHADHGDVDRAVHHAIAARDAALTGELLWRNFLQYASYGRNSSIQGWLDRFTDDQVAGHPALALAAAGSQLARGDRNLLERWTSAAELCLEDPTQNRLPSLEGGVSILRAAATDGIVRTLELAGNAYELFAEDDPWRSLCCLLIGSARHLSGERDRARAMLEEGARRGAWGAPGIQALCLAQLSLLALDDGDAANAIVHATRARGQIERFGLMEYPTSALVFAVSAAAHAQCGRIDEAKMDARRAAELTARLADSAGWYEIEVRIALARASLRLSDMAGARSQLAEASRLLRRSPDAVVLGEWLEDGWTWADSAIGHSVGDRWSLTTAELRILQFLPTHLSLPEIAKELNVSANTVKTHTRAVYRKLDASSRSEAVTRARGAGLINASRLTLAEAA
jgi:LuxR family maltose regulon positive regulatory protein